MSETKIQINERKIRNGQRKSTEAQQKQMWNKLSCLPSPIFPKIKMSVTKKRVTAVSHKLKQPIYWEPDMLLADETELRGKTFDAVLIDEWVNK